MGTTKVLASVTGEIVEPTNDRPNEGQIMFNVDFSPMASPYFDSSRPSPKSVEIARLVERCVKDAGAVDTETLCIVAGQRVWMLRVDVRVLNYDGNMTDCCALAAVAALVYYRRPDITVTSHGVTIHSEEEKDFIPIQLNFWPISNTYAYFTEPDEAVVDPSLSEDLTCDSHITIAMNAQKEVCCIQKPGGSAVSHDIVMGCVMRASQRTKGLVELLKKEYEAKVKSKAHKHGLEDKLQRK